MIDVFDNGGYAHSSGGWFSTPQPTNASVDTRLDSVPDDDAEGLIAALESEFEGVFFEGSDWRMKWIFLKRLGTVGDLAEKISAQKKSRPEAMTADSPRKSKKVAYRCPGCGKKVGGKSPCPFCGTPPA